MQFSVTNNMSLNRCDIVDNDNKVNSNIKEIVKKRIVLAFEELLSLKIEEDKIEIDYATIDALTVEQWQAIFENNK